MWRQGRILLRQGKCLDTLEMEKLGFPGGTVVGNLPANAGRHGFEPWSGRIPCAAEQLSPCAITGEATAVRSPSTTDKSGPLLAAARESPRRAAKTQCRNK